MDIILTVLGVITIVLLSVLLFFVVKSKKENVTKDAGEEIRQAV